MAGANDIASLLLLMLFPHTHTHTQQQQQQQQQQAAIYCINQSRFGRRHCQQIQLLTFGFGCKLNGI
ncbi:MAG: hypothetical protein N6V41_00850 [Candidatus Portiera aleyrodidarum]|nr:hypothetical protein [Candidatus Portiera aleyrodidarum]